MILKTTAVLVSSLLAGTCWAQVELNKATEIDLDVSGTRYSVPLLVDVEHRDARVGRGARSVVTVERSGRERMLVPARTQCGADGGLDPRAVPGVPAVGEHGQGGLLDVALHGAIGAARRDPAIAHGLNTVRGSHTNAIVAELLGSHAVDALGADR